jgi:hypothetical protein
MSIAHPYVHTLWCDDIRMEVGNKPSFMGVFTGDLLVPAIPTVLPRLGAYTWVVWPNDEPLQSLRLQVIRDDGLVLAEVRPEGQTPVLAAGVDHAAHQERLIGVNMGPVEIPDGCRWFMVKVKTDGVELESAKLRVIRDPARFAATLAVRSDA